MASEHAQNMTHARQKLVNATMCTFFRHPELAPILYLTSDLSLAVYMEIRKYMQVQRVVRKILQLKYQLYK